MDVGKVAKRMTIPNAGKLEKIKNGFIEVHIMDFLIGYLNVCLYLPVSIVSPLVRAFPFFFCEGITTYLKIWVTFTAVINACTLLYCEFQSKTLN